MNNLGFAILRAVGPQHGIDPAAATGVWRGDNVSDLPTRAWDELVNNGYIGKAGSFQPPAPPPPQNWSNGTAIVRQGGQDGYMTQEYEDHGEQGGFTSSTWHAGAPPEQSAPESQPAQQSESQPAQPDPVYQDNGAWAARDGGLIPPAMPGEEPQPVPMTAHTGEFVIRPEAVQQFGPEMLTAINAGTFPQMPPGGQIAMAQPMAGEDGDGMDGDEEGDMMGMGMGMGEDGDGLDGDEDSGPWDRPYAAEAQSGPSPFERLTAGGQPGGDPLSVMKDLPPPVQQAMLASLGADPLLASAWLKVLGPKYQQMIAEALKVGGQMKAAMAGPAAAPGMAPGAPPAPAGPPPMV
jgi:hypothetical protein